MNNSPRTQRTWLLVVIGVLVVAIGGVMYFAGSNETAATEGGDSPATVAELPRGAELAMGSLADPGAVAVAVPNNKQAKSDETVKNSDAEAAAVARGVAEARREGELAAAEHMRAAQEKQRLREEAVRAAAEDAKVKAEAVARAAAAAAADKAHHAQPASSAASPLTPELREALAYFKAPGRKIVLMGNDGVQEFLPQRGQRMGGIENAVVTLANGLHRLGFDFVVLAQCTPMDPVSSTTPLAGVPYTVYCMPPSAGFVPGCQEFVRNMNPKPAIVLGQSDWAARVAQATDVPMVVTSHDSAPGIAQRHDYHPKVLYRFLSDWMRKAWVHEGATNYGRPWLGPRSFYAYHSIEPDACPAMLPKNQRSGHIMYLSSGWGPVHKGLDKFCEFAKRAQSITNRSFHVYGPNPIPPEYQNLPNLKAMGDVAGKTRDDAYRNAILYVMLTQIPEAFGRVTLEAMCLGTPVLSSCFGTQPELIYGDKGGWSTNNNYDQMLAFLKKVEQADDAYFAGVQRYATTTFVQDEEIARLLFAGRLLIEYPEPAEHEKRLGAYFTPDRAYAGNSRVPSEQTTQQCMEH